MVLTSPDALTRMFPRCDAAKWISPLINAMNEFGINTPQRQAAFLAQAAHESSEFTRLEEGLNYAATRLTVVWPKRFPSLAKAQPFDRQPDKIANEVYSNRMGNGPPESGDGFKFRGRGIFQITGKDNYTMAGIALKLPLLSKPELLLDPEGAARSAGWFWKMRGLSSLADFNPGDNELEDFRKISYMINGGNQGITERIAYWEKTKRIML